MKTLVVIFVAFVGLLCATMGSKLGSEESIPAANSMILNWTLQSQPELERAVTARWRDFRLKDFVIQRVTRETVAGALYRIYLDCSITSCPKQPTANCIPSQMNRNVNCVVSALHKAWEKEDPTIQVVC